MAAMKSQRPDQITDDATGSSNPNMTHACPGATPTALTLIATSSTNRQARASRLSGAGLCVRRAAKAINASGTASSNPQPDAAAVIPGIRTIVATKYNTTAISNSARIIGAMRLAK